MASSLEKLVDVTDKSDFTITKREFGNKTSQFYVMVFTPMSTSTAKKNSKKQDYHSSTIFSANLQMKLLTKKIMSMPKKYGKNSTA